MCASHQGEKLHTDTARSMLKKLDLTIEDYECGSHEPLDKNTRNNLIRAKKLPPNYTTIVAENMLEC